MLLHLGLMLVGGTLQSERLALVVFEQRIRYANELAFLEGHSEVVGKHAVG